MRERLCENCYYFEQCGKEIACMQYTPIDETNDDLIDELIEKKRAEFLLDWIRYVDEEEY